MSFNGLISEFTSDFACVVEVSTDDCDVGSTLNNTKIRDDFEDVWGTVIIEGNTIICPFLVVEGDFDGDSAWMGVRG